MSKRYIMIEYDPDTAGEHMKDREEDEGPLALEDYLFNELDNDGIVCTMTDFDSNPLFGLNRIDVVTWEPTGSHYDKRSRLLAQITVCGVAMHLEAYAVVNRVDYGQHIADNSFLHEWEGICNLNTDSPFQTLEIEGREYVLIAQPHGD